MNNIYIFDVDGTLTPSRKQMTKEFQEVFFNEWSEKNTFYLVSGSDLEKMSEQVPQYILDRADGLFCCSGNHYFKDGKEVYYNEYKPADDLLQFLQETLLNSQYEVRAGNHIEDRNSMLNFSVIGRDCTQEQREEYYKWDKEKGERKIIANAIKEKFPDLDAVIGGQISIDIYPKGNDKSQIMKHITDNLIREVHPDIYNVDTEFIFIGDRTEQGGNDYPLAKLMEETDNCSYYQTEGWEQTKEILESLND